jgi:hypothetical protein
MKGVEPHIEAMAIGILADLVPGAAPPAVPRWRTFLNAMHQRVEMFAGEEEALIRATIGGVSIGGYSNTKSKTTSSPSDYCPFCGREGHSNKECRIQTQGGRCVCGIHITAGSSCSDLADDVHSAARQRNAIGPNKNNKRKDYAKKDGRDQTKEAKALSNSNETAPAESTSTHTSAIEKLLETQEMHHKALMNLINDQKQTKEDLMQQFDVRFTKKD